MKENTARAPAKQNAVRQNTARQSGVRLLAVSAAVSLAAVVAMSRYIDAQAAAKAGAARTAAAVKAPAAEPQSGFPARDVLDQYCVTCHNQRLKTGGLVLETADLMKVGENAAVWEKVHNKLVGGLMPPRTAKPLPDAVRADMVSWLEKGLDGAAAANPNLGRPRIFHRINRAEYRNIVRDLLAVNIDVSELLPKDDAGGGFDNMASVLKISPSHMDAYLAASRKISRLAVGRVVGPPAAVKYDAHAQQSQYEWLEGLPFGTRGGMLVKHLFPTDGKYEIKVQLNGPTSPGGRQWYLTETLYILLDGEIVHTVQLPGRKAESERPPALVEAEAVVTDLGPAVVEGVKYYLGLKNTPAEIAKMMGMSQAEVEAVAMWSEASKGGDLYVTIPVKAGLYDVGATFARTVFPVLEGPRKPFETPGREGMGVVPQPFVGAVEIVGPFDPVTPKDTPSLKKIYVCRPSSKPEEPACAKTIFRNLARLAYRRPVTDADIDILLASYEEGRTGGGSFESGVEAGVRRLLVSPNFLYRIELPPAEVAAGITPVSAVSPARASLYPLNDIALASRLSFFLWSSIPDDELLRVAERGQLHQSAELARQVKRMLADSRASALVENFAGQWLGIRDVDVLDPYELAYPDFDAALQSAIKRELELFFESIYKENRSVLDFVRADYTFVNDRLARHYDIPNVQGAHFRRVTLPPDSPRVGLLGKAAIQLVTSNNARTSPVRRGKWILVNILGTPPPEPPANVPPLPERPGGDMKMVSMRERMSQHRASPVCASCHAMIDPLGFALEQFDLTGKYRPVDDLFRPIDVSGNMPDGTKFDSLAQFRGLLLRQPDMFAMTFTRRLLQYALGRELAYYDEPTVRAIVRDAKQSDYRFSSLVMGILESKPFRMRQFDVGGDQRISLR